MENIEVLFSLLSANRRDYAMATQLALHHVSDLRLGSKFNRSIPADSLKQL